MPVQTRSMIKRTKEQQMKEQQIKEQQEIELIREKLRRKTMMDHEQCIEKFQQIEYSIGNRLEEIELKQYLTEDDIEFIRMNELSHYSLFNSTKSKIISLIKSLFLDLEDLNDNQMSHMTPDVVIKIYRETEKYLILGKFSNKFDKKMIMITLNKINELKPKIKDHQNIIEKDKILMFQEFDRFTNSINRIFPDVE